MEWTRRDVLGSILVLIGVSMVLGAVGTGDVKSLSPNGNFASDSTLFFLGIVGFLVTITGVRVLTKKGGKHGRRAKKIW